MDDADRNADDSSVDWGFDDIDPVRRRVRSGAGAAHRPEAGAGEGPVVTPSPAAGDPSVAAGTAAAAGGIAAAGPPAAADRGTRVPAAAVWRHALAIPHRGAILTVLFFAGWSLLLTFPYFGFGSMSFVVLHDTAEMNLPRAVWYGDPAAATGMGSWSPMGVSGTDRLASGFSAGFDTLLFASLPGWLAYGLFMWLQRFLAGLFFYRLLREWKDVTPLAAAAVGCAYALFTQPHVNMGWTGFALYDGLALPGLPLALYVLFRAARWRARYRYPTAVAAGLLFAFSSHFFLALFGVLAVCAVALVGFPCRDRKRFWVAPLLFAGAWLAGELPVLWAAATSAGLSHRGDRALLDVNTRSGVVYRQWLTEFLRDNALALVLTGSACVLAMVRRSWRVLAVIGVGGLCALLVGGAPFLRDTIFSHLGPLAGFRFDRLFVVLPFLTLLAGGLGLGLLPRLSPPFSPRRVGPPGRRYHVPVQALAGLAILLAIVVQAIGVQARIGGEMEKGATYESLYGSPQIARLAAARRPDDPFRVASINAPLGRAARDAWHPGYAWAYGLETADGYSVLYSQRYQDFWLRVIDARIGRSKDIRRYYERWGNRVYLFASRNYLNNPLGIMPSKRWNLTLLALANVRYFISPVKLRDDSLTLLPYGRRAEQEVWPTLSLGERREIAGRGEFPGLPLYVYRNERVFPRAFLVGQTRVLDRPRQVLDEMARAGYGGLRGTAYLTPTDVVELGLDEQPLPLAEPAAGEGGSAIDGGNSAHETGAGGPADAVRVTSYRTDEVGLRVDAPTRALLVVTNSYSPYWKAWVDGEQVPLAPVDHTFLGLVVPAGRHEVSVKYSPPYGFLAWQ